MAEAGRRPILVTGAHRSGTTWVGKTIAASPSIGYIDEPFSPILRHYNPGVCNVNYDFWWMYITKENEIPFYNAISATMDFRYNFIAQVLRIIKNKCGIRTLIKGYSSFFINRNIYHARPLIKDPIALFSAPWLAERFNMKVIILIRHPAAFVSSIKRMNWPHDFANFLNQPLLMKDHLAPFEKDIKTHIETKLDIIDDAILLWRMFYFFINKLRQTHKNFIFTRHEDLSLNPVEEYEKIFSRLNIDFTEKIKNFILNSTRSSNPAEAPAGIEHHLKRNSKENIKNWKNRLSVSEINRVKEAVADISKFFYSEKDWL
jgi:hypothetical protein